MTITKISTRSFKYYIEQARDEWADEAETWDNDYRGYLRAHTKVGNVCLWNECDAWKAAKAHTPATFAEIVADLSIAAARRMQFGATEAQVEQIARLAVKAGLPLGKISMNTLDRTEAARIIATF